MAGYFEVSMRGRFAAACFTGLVTLFGTVATAFLGLAALDGGSDLPPILAYGLVLAWPFIAAALISSVLTLGPRYWPFLSVGIGGAVGALVTILLEPTLPGYPWNHHAIAAVMYFALPALGSFVGTYARAPGQRKPGLP